MQHEEQKVDRVAGHDRRVVAIGSEADQAGCAVPEHDRAGELDPPVGAEHPWRGDAGARVPSAAATSHPSQPSSTSTSSWTTTTNSPRGSRRPRSSLQEIRG